MVKFNLSPELNNLGIEKLNQKEGVCKYVPIPRFGLNLANELWAGSGVEFKVVNPTRFAL